MKKVFIVLAAILFSFQTFSQSSKLFEDVEVSRFRGGMSSDPTCIIYATLVTDIPSGNRDGFVTIRTSDSAIVYRDEIESAISTLKYAKENLVTTKPKSDTRAVYLSSTDCKIGVRYYSEAIIRGWSPFIQTNLLDNNSLVTFKTSELDSIIAAMKEAADKIDSFIQGQ